MTTKEKLLTTEVQAALLERGIKDRELAEMIMRRIDQHFRFTRRSVREMADLPLLEDGSKPRV